MKATNIEIFMCQLVFKVQRYLTSTNNFTIKDTQVNTAVQMSVKRIICTSIGGKSNNNFSKIQVF